MAFRSASIVFILLLGSPKGAVGAIYRIAKTADCFDGFLKSYSNFLIGLEFFDHTDP